MEKTADQLLTKSFRKFWQTIKGLKGKDNRISNIIDGKHNESDIANHFHDIYANLYSSVEDNSFKNVANNVHDLVKNRCNVNSANRPAKRLINNRVYCLKVKYFIEVRSG